MILDKRSRLKLILDEFVGRAPYASGEHARVALEEVFRLIEDRHSGITENLDAATSPPDGRMYPPHELHERESENAAVRLFIQRGHRTWFARNGAVRIARKVDGAVELDLPGADGLRVSEMLGEDHDEPNRNTARPN